MEPIQALLLVIVALANTTTTTTTTANYTNTTATVEPGGGWTSVIAGAIEAAFNAILDALKAAVKALLGEDLYNKLSAILGGFISLLKSLWGFIALSMQLAAPLLTLAWFILFIRNPIDTIERTIEVLRKIISLLHSIINTIIPI
ncbi:MAG: hypothetical protein GSR85_06935 [Desulfurococcales archaeon]|nr:hypothetical protein [Desulfurococcales archaeon]